MNNFVTQSDEMVHFIAHQWKQPLAALMGELTLLDLDLAKCDESGSMAKRVRNATLISQSMVTAVNSIGVLFGNQHIPSEINATTFDFAGMDVQKSLKIPNGFYSSKVVLTEAVKNLLVNALQASDDACVELDVSEDADRLMISITDNCGGIPDQVLEGLGHERIVGSSGWGIGLIIARRLIESIGGEFYVSVGDFLDKKGTRFALLIPNQANSHSSLMGMTPRKEVSSAS